MTLAEECIAELDNALAEAGSDAVLRRFFGTGPNQTWVDVTLRVAERAPTEDELVAGYSQNDMFIVTSPTQLINAQFPGGQPVGSKPAWLPKAGTGADKLFIFDQQRQIELVDPIKVDNTVVRINLKLKG